MNCKYSYQGELNFDRHYLYCKISKTICSFVQYCPIVGDIISSDGSPKCPTYLKAESNIGYSPLTPNKVVFERNGNLYVELNDEYGQVVSTPNPFDYTPKFVKLLKNNDNEYYVRK